MADQTITPRRQKVNLSEELVSGLLANARFLTFIGQITQALPKYVDDAQRDFGLDIYDRMRRDPAISSALRTIKIKVVSEGVRIVPGLKQPSQFGRTPEEQASYDKATEIAQFVDSCLSNLQAPLTRIIKQMLNCMAYGYQVAEQVYEIRGSELRLTKLKVKPRPAYSFVVDNVMNLIGLAAVKPGQEATTSGLSLIKPGEVIPREKFLVMSFEPDDDDPRGTSLLRAVYNVWFLSQHVFPEWFKFLKQFATPSVAGTLPEDAGEVELIDATGTVQDDGSGNPTYVRPEDAMVMKLVNWLNGSAIALPHGAEVDILESKGDGAAYTAALDYFDRAKVSAILLAARAVMEAKNGSRADSETAQDVLNDFTQDLRGEVEEAFNRDVIRPLVLYNFGAEAAATMCPKLNLSDTPREDRAEIINGVANLQRSGYLHSSQFAELDAQLGLPERDMDAMQAEMDADRQAEEDRRQMLAGLGDITGAGRRNADDADNGDE